jgi:aminocarboxymuconate-semialdehyde decarboxylase
MGTDRIMLGSDYPFPLGEQSIGKLVAEQPGFSDADKRAIYADNAVEFFGLQALVR